MRDFNFIFAGFSDIFGFEHESSLKIQITYKIIIFGTFYEHISRFDYMFPQKYSGSKNNETCK